MKDRKYNRMFLVSGDKRKFLNPQTGELITIRSDAGQQYDLPNENIYNTSGELIEEAGQIANNTSFLLYLIGAYCEDVPNFLTYHFSNTPDKLQFLDFVEHAMMPDVHISTITKGYMNRWIIEKRNFIKTQQVTKTKNEPQNLAEIFPLDKSKIIVVQEGIKDLSITKDCSERTISGFIEGCKLAHALPDINIKTLLAAIYFEIGKPFTASTKARKDQQAYIDSLTATKKYFGINRPNQAGPK